MNFAVYSVVVIAGYLLGSIPTGFLVGRWKGIDVRKQGSGNIGATNAFRILGKPAGSFVLLFDALKGYLACTVVAAVALRIAGPDAAVSSRTLSILGGLGAVLGHNYTCWLNFKGGKGIATSAGVLLAWIPMALLVVFVTWLVVFLASKYVSLASIAAAVALPFAVWLTRAEGVYLWITVVLSSLAIYKHLPNIRRLLNGTENRFGKPKTSASSHS